MCPAMGPRHVVTHSSVGKPPDGSLYGNPSVMATPKLFRVSI